MADPVAFERVKVSFQCIARNVAVRVNEAMTEPAEILDGSAVHSACWVENGPLEDFPYGHWLIPEVASQEPVRRGTMSQFGKQGSSLAGDMSANVEVCGAPRVQCRHAHKRSLAARPAQPPS